MKIPASVMDVMDDSFIDLEYEKNLTKIDYEKMKTSVKETHATKGNGDFYNCKEVCYKFKPGQHYLLKSSENSELTKFGVGILLYFKFIKQLILYFGLFCLISIPAYIFYIAAFVQYSPGTNSVSYLDLLTATTLGSVGMSASYCGLAGYPDGSRSTDEITIYLECTSGVIADVGNIVYGFVDSGTTCSFIGSNDVDDACNIYDIATLESDFSAYNCVGSSSCELQLNSNMFVSQGSDSYCDNLYNYYNVYLQVQCISNDVQFGDKDNSISKEVIGYVVTSLDAVISILFLVMIYTLKFSQRSATENVLKKAYSAASYTIQVKNLPQDMASEELAAQLWSIFDQQLLSFDPTGAEKVVDVQIVLPNRLIECSKNIGDIIHQKNTLIRTWMQLYTPDYAGKEIDFRGVHNLMVQLKAQKSPQVKEAEKLYKDIKNLVIKKEKLLLEVKKLKTTRNVKMVCAFITFNSINARNKILDMFSSTAIQRAFAICFGKKGLNFYGHTLRVKSADDPGSILWENLGEPGPKVFLRRTFSNFLTIMLWVLTGLILCVSTYYKNQFKNKFPSIDCTNEDPTISEAVEDYKLGDYQAGYLQCYCSKDWFGRLNTVFTDYYNEKLCYDLFQDKVLAEGITFAIVFVVLVINYGVQFVFRILSKFEKHSTLNQELAQRVLKTFVGQFLNTGIILLVVNARLTDNTKVWQGKFSDITSLWYSNVGSTLLSTMFINVFSVPAIKFVEVIFNLFARCFDRGCGCNSRKTKRKTQAAYESLYSGPEFYVDTRYSQILTLIFVCLLYSGGMPFLYVTSFIQLVLSYFVDKYFLLRITKLPKNYDQHLAIVVRLTLYGAVFIHLLFAIFMFGQPDILKADASFLSASASSISDSISSDKENVIVKYFKRMVTGHNISLSVILIAVIVLYLVKGLFYNFFKNKIIGAFKKDHDHSRRQSVVKKSTKNFVEIESLPFLRVIRSEDIENLIRLTKVTLKTTTNENLQAHLKQKIETLKKEYHNKRAEEDNKQVDPNVNFIGFYTYDVRLNPTYKSQFAMDELLDDENIN